MQFPLFNRLNTIYMVNINSDPLFCLSQQPKFINYDFPLNQEKGKLESRSKKKNYLRIFYEETTSNLK